MRAQVVGDPADELVAEQLGEVDRGIVVGVELVQRRLVAHIEQPVAVPIDANRKEIRDARRDADRPAGALPGAHDERQGLRHQGVARGEIFDRITEPDKSRLQRARDTRQVPLGVGQPLDVLRAF